MYIALCGSHSTGKTTVVKSLIPILQQAYRRDVYYISEVTRKLKEKFGVSINKEGTADTQRLIESEYAREEDLHPEMIKIADRTIIDRFAYTLTGVSASDGDIVEWYDRNAESVCKKYSHIFYIPLTDSVQLELDGVRSADEEYRRQVDTTIATLLKKYNIKTYVLTGTNEQRIAQIKTVLEI